MVDKLSSLFPYSSSQSFQIRSIASLAQKTNEEKYVSSRIDKMSSGSFVLRFPDLDCHGLGEDLLGEFRLGRCCHDLIWRFVVYDVRSLCNMSILVVHTLSCDGKY